MLVPIVNQIVKTNDVVSIHEDEEIALNIEVNKLRSVVVVAGADFNIIVIELVVHVRISIYVVQVLIDSCIKKMDLKVKLFVVIQLTKAVGEEDIEITMLILDYFSKMVPDAPGTNIVDDLQVNVVLVVRVVVLFNYLEEVVADEERDKVAVSVDVN